MLLAAIKHELIKKSKLKIYLFGLFLPIKERLSWIITHKKLHYQWETFVWYQYIDTGNLFYKPMSYFFSVFKKFWLNHWKWIVGIAVTLLAIYLK